MANGLYGGGEGTEESPFLIEDGQDMTAISAQLSTYPMYYYKLTNDIDMSLVDYAIIGDTSKGPPFMGVFDGDGYAVKGIRLIKEKSGSGDYLGMFGIISGGKAIIRNLTIKDIYISSQDADSIGILAGNIANGATVENCNFEGTIKARQAFLGGVGAFVNNTKVSNVAVNLKAEAHKVGAIIHSASNCVIENCTTEGTITGYNTYSALASLVLVVGNGTVIRNSGSTISMSNKYDGEFNYSKIMPLVDEVSESAKVENCFVALSGLLYPQWLETKTYYSNAIVTGTDGNIYVCYEYLVSGNPDANPVDGSAWSDFWKAHVIPDALTAEQLKDKNTFINWDFENTWVMGDNGPELQIFYTQSDEIPDGDDNDNNNDNDNDIPSDIVIVTDVDFTKTKMMHDVFGRVIPQVWDHENNRFVPVTLQMIKLMMKR